jgi:hypothetical protein
MNSLEELNVYGTELEVDFADWRSADVILTDYNPADLNVVEITYYNNKVPNATEIASDIFISGSAASGGVFVFINVFLTLGGIVSLLSAILKII